MNTTYDIAIVGLGPAGSILARLLSDKFKIIAIDKKNDLKNGFQKPCGGLLSSDAQKVFARFNITIPKSILVDPQIFSVKTIDENNKLLRYYQRFYININRHKFDLWLKSIIPSNVNVYNNSNCTNIEKIDTGYKVTFSENGKKQTITTKYLVGADGANSIVRRTIYPNKKIRTYMAIQQWFFEEHETPFYSCIFDNEITDCCSWSISKDNHFIFGGAYPLDKSKEKFEKQKKNLINQGFKFGELLKTEACLVLRPSKYSDFCCGKNNAFLIGESAGFISPSSLEGISSAIISAEYLSKVLNSYSKNPNKKYRQKTFKLRLKIFSKLFKCPFMYNPTLRKIVLKSKVNSIDVIKIENDF